MTQEDKKLLLIDLCARLPYGVIVKNDKLGIEGKLLTVSNYQPACGYILTDIASGNQEYTLIEDVKPYLRPMSSMTEEERKELKEISDEYLDKWMSVNDPSVRCELDAKISSKRAEFYNSHYLDWNGIIGNVALEAPSDMYKIE